MDTGSTASALAAYEPLAEVYDLFTADHDYESWVSSIERVAHKHGLRGDRVLDVACGTGKSLAPWFARGYRVAGCDLSPRMLRGAAQLTRGRVHLFRADMRRLPPGDPVDLVTCIDDAVNYLLHPADLHPTFVSAASRLERGGLYVFDLNSLRAYREDFAADRRVARGGWEFHWKGQGDVDAPPACTAVAMLSAVRGDAPERERLLSRHVQRHHPVPVVLDALAKAGTDQVWVYGQHRDGSLDDEFDELRHTKALLVARKG